MIPALITAGVGAFGTAVIFLVMFLDNRAAEQGRADARVDAEHLRGELATMTADRDTQKSRGDAEKKRADALDDLIAKHAADAVGPVSGSFQRLLQEWAAPGDHAAGRAASALPEGASADPPGGLRLIKPGDI